MLTSTSYWLSGHCIPASNFVPLWADLHYECLLSVLSDKGVCSYQSASNVFEKRQQQVSWLECHCFKLQDKLFPFVDNLVLHALSTESSACAWLYFCSAHATKPEWKSELKRPRSYVFLQKHKTMHAASK